VGNHSSQQYGSCATLTYLRQGSRISISKRSVELAAGINTAYQGAVYTMECAQDGSGVSVKAIYQ
jgi:hypothetical protein